MGAGFSTVHPCAECLLRLLLNGKITLNDLGLLELKSNTQIFSEPFGALPAHGASVRRSSPAIQTHTQG